jgi:hypothetical protein
MFWNFNDLLKTNQYRANTMGRNNKNSIELNNISGHSKIDTKVILFVVNKS